MINNYTLLSSIILFRSQFKSGFDILLGSPAFMNLLNVRNSLLMKSYKH